MFSTSAKILWVPATVFAQLGVSFSKCCQRVFPTDKAGLLRFFCFLPFLSFSVPISVVPGPFLPDVQSLTLLPNNQDTLCENICPVSFVQRFPELLLRKHPHQSTGLVNFTRRGYSGLHSHSPCLFHAKHAMSTSLYFNLGPQVRFLPARASISANRFALSLT